MTKIQRITANQIDAVLPFLEQFEKPDFTCGGWQQPVSVEPNVFIVPTFAFTKAAESFVQCLYDYGWIEQFDWGEWTGTAAQYVDSPNLLASADVASIRKLLTTHVRQDRFCEGHLASMFENGHIVGILQRLKEIRQSMEPPPKMDLGHSPGKPSMTTFQLRILQALAGSDGWTTRNEIKQIVGQRKGYAAAMGAPTAESIGPNTLEGMGYIEHRKAGDTRPVWPLEYRLTSAGKESLSHATSVPRSDHVLDLVNTDKPKTYETITNSVTDPISPTNSRFATKKDTHMTEDADASTDNNGMAEDDSEPIEIGNEPMRVIYQLKTPTVRALYEQWKEGDLVLAPDFQRHFVWNKQKASNLIESLLLNIPLPLIFTAEFTDKEEVIDGQQRLTSIFSFIDGKLPNDQAAFRLSKKLKLMASQIGGKTFAELDKSHQKDLRNRGLQVVCISKDSQEDVKFEMFERLNTNITPLNAQELRNCLWRGAYNDFLARMAEYDDYQYILNKPKMRPRMLDVENVLMFCTFLHRSPDHYSKSLKQNMNEDMRSHQNMSAAEQEALERQFKKTVRLVKHIWGQNAFNIYTIDPDTKRGEYSKQFNQGLFQIIMYWFTPYEPPQVIPFADLIREELIHLQVHDSEFMETLTGSGTNSASNVRKKFDIWGNTIKGILKYPSNAPRAFSSQLKRSLWEADQTCQICGQKVIAPEDAEVDHITCYWKGGKTIPTNGRLTHRFCNRQRGGK